MKTKQRNLRVGCLELLPAYLYNQKGYDGNESKQNSSSGRLLKRY